MPRFLSDGIPGARLGFGLRPVGEGGVLEGDEPAVVAADERPYAHRRTFRHRAAHAIIAVASALVMVTGTHPLEGLLVCLWAKKGVPRVGRRVEPVSPCPGRG
jgi:hypothetical protein